MPHSTFTWHFIHARTWEELLAVHQRWWDDFNAQRHFAHQDRDDGRHSPAALLGWVMGTQHDPEELRRVFTTLRVDRRLDRAGYVRFRHWRIYGEMGVAGCQVAVWLAEELLTIEVAGEPVAQCLVAYDALPTRLHSVVPLRQFKTRYRSSQLPLWELSADEWRFVVPLREYAPRRQRRNVAAQDSLAL